MNYERGSIILGILICLLSIHPTTAAGQQIVEVMSRHENMSIFTNTIRQAGIESKLNSGGPFTILAPSNSALESIKDRLDRNNGSSLENFVMNHVFTGMATKRQVMAMSKAPTLGGLVLNMDVDQNDNVRVNGIRIVEYNIRAQNGVIHVIEGPLE